LPEETKSLKKRKKENKHLREKFLIYILKMFEEFLFINEYLIDGKSISLHRYACVRFDKCCVSKTAKKFM